MRAIQKAGIEIPQGIRNILEALSRRTAVLTHEAYIDSIRVRQEAVDQFLLRGGAEALRQLFNYIKKLEGVQPIRIDLSMLEISGRILGGLYLPGANLEKLVFTESDLTGSDLTGANLSEAVAVGAKMTGVVASGANFTSAVIPYADLSGARLIGCTFNNTVMQGVKIDKDTNFVGARFVGTYLTDVDLSIANTTGAVIRGIRS